MAKPDGTKTELMRVPRIFKIEVERIAKKRNYPTTTKFLKQDGVRVMKNADHLNDMLDMFRGSKVSK